MLNKDLQYLQNTSRLLIGVSLTAIMTGKMICLQNKKILRAAQKRKFTLSWKSS